MNQSQSTDRGYASRKFILVTATFIITAAWVSLGIMPVSLFAETTIPLVLLYCGFNVWQLKGTAPPCAPAQ
jgi:hypothetical protein